LGGRNRLTAEKVSRPKGAKFSIPDEEGRNDHTIKMKFQKRERMLSGTPWVVLSRGGGKEVRRVLN